MQGNGCWYRCGTSCLQKKLIFRHFNAKNISDFQALHEVILYKVIAFQMTAQNGKSKQSTLRRGTSEWVGFPSSSFLNPIGSSPFNKSSLKTCSPYCRSKIREQAYVFLFGYDTACFGVPKTHYLLTAYLCSITLLESI